MTFESFLELAEKRYSVRSYSNKEIEKDKLDKILKTGQLATTAGNFQPQRIFVLQSKKALDKARRSRHFVLTLQ